MIDDLLIVVFKSVELLAELSADLYHWLRSDDAESDD
jgi:hypothetical protein